MSLSFAHKYLLLFSGGATRAQDDFTADAGNWLDGNLAPAAMTIAAGAGSWTPTLGSELLSNAGLEVATGNWNAVNATWTAVADPRTGSAGSNSANLARAGGNGNLNQSATTVSLWHQFTGWRRNVDASGGTRVVMTSGGPGGTEIVRFAESTSTTWASFFGTGRILTTLCSAVLHNIAAADPTGVRYDDISIKQLTLASQFRLKRLNNVASVQAEITRTTRTQAGVVLFQDVNNWVLAYLVGNSQDTTLSAKLMKCVAGTITSDLVVGVVTEVPGAVLSLVKADTTYTVTYNSLLVNSAVIADAFTFGHAGIFTTYSGTTFDDFAAAV